MANLKFEHIYNQDSAAPMNIEQLRSSKRIIVNANKELKNVKQLLKKTSPEQLRANDLVKMKGALSWLTTMPSKSENFNLNKREFYDAISF